MLHFTQRLQQVIGTALILAFFSEFYFLNDAPIKDLLEDLESNAFYAIIRFLELPLYYGLFAYPMLICFGHFKISNWAGLILVASIYGLATEALVVPLVYEAIPFSLFWTSLSWHTLIDVLFGWFLLRRAMRARALWPVVLLMSVAGIFWGVWATWFWGETPEVALSLTAFSSVTVTTTLALLTGMALADRAPLTEFKATKLEVLILAVVSMVLFGLTGWPYFPLPIVILAVLGVVFAALNTSRNQTRGALLASLDQPPKWSRYLTVAILPATAIASYAMVLKTGFQIPAEDVVLLILTAGALSFVAALIHPFWTRFRT